MPAENRLLLEFRRTQSHQRPNASSGWPFTYPVQIMENQTRFDLLPPLKTGGTESCATESRVLMTGAQLENAFARFDFRIPPPQRVERSRIIQIGLRTGRTTSADWQRIPKNRTVRHDASSRPVRCLHRFFRTCHVSFRLVVSHIVLCPTHPFLVLSAVAPSLSVSCRRQLPGYYKCLALIYWTNRIGLLVKFAQSHAGPTFSAEIESFSVPA